MEIDEKLSHSFCVTTQYDTTYKNDYIASLYILTQNIFTARMYQRPSLRHFDTMEEHTVSETTSLATNYNNPNLPEHSSKNITRDWRR